MRRAIHRLALIAGGLLAVGAARLDAQMRHGGVPERVVAERQVGPYRVSVWAKPDVGMAMVYAVYSAPDDAAFIPPTSVRVGVAPVSGRLPEVVHHAHPEEVAYGARFVAHLTLDRAEAWRVRVVTDGPAGSAEVTTEIEAVAGSIGPLDVALYTLPVTLIGGLWGLALVARRRGAAPRPLPA